ncbi:hypothetical protein IG631_01501 [Alternaria alternata]|nr:hypothetical protein IG631_01501 [Alternaria alternata]
MDEHAKHVFVQYLRGWHSLFILVLAAAARTDYLIPTISYRLTTIDQPSTVGVAYSSSANLVTKSLLMGAYCLSCCCSDSESRSRCRSSRSSATTNTDATLTISLPSATPLPPWCGVLMNMTPYVDSLIERCSARATWRAVSEWMSACGC